MSSQIYNHLWLSTQTLESINVEIDRNPNEVINHLIDQIFDENAPNPDRALSMRALRALDLTTFNVHLRASIEHSVRHVLEFENFSSDSDSDSDSDTTNTEDLDTQEGYSSNSETDVAHTVSSEEEREDVDASLERVYLELEAASLVDSGPKPDNDPETIREELIEYCRMADLANIDATLAKGNYLETVDPKTGFTPICWAAYHRNDEIFEYLIHCGAKIDSKQEPIFFMIEKWVKDKKYDQLRLLLRKGFELGSQFSNHDNFLNLILKHGVNIATLLEPMSEDWKIVYSQIFPDILPEHYELVPPEDFAIVFSVESYLDYILQQNNFDFLKGNIIVCLAQFLSKDKTLTRSVELLKRLKFDQQCEFIEGLDNDLERLLIKDVYIKEARNLKEPLNLFSERFTALKKFTETTNQQMHVINNESKIDDLMAAINVYQTKKIPLWSKQARYLGFWIDDLEFNKKREEFKGYIKELFTIQSKLMDEKRRFQRKSANMEEAIFSDEEKGEILYNPVQYNTKIYVLHKALEQRIGCSKEYIYENHEQLYRLFYSTFDDHAREVNNLRKSSEENKAQEATLKLYKAELRVHLGNVLTQKKITSPSDIIL